MKLIELTKGHFAKVSDEDYEMLMEYKWFAVNSKSKLRKPKFYARTRRNYAHIYMHRLIMRPIPPGMFIDHIDGNGLNNQRENLRFLSPSENAHAGKKKEKVTLEQIEEEWGWMLKK